jgi:hypothetical protein
MHQQAGVQVGLASGGRPDYDGAVRLAGCLAVAIRNGCRKYGLDATRAGRTHDTQGYFATVGHEQSP